MPQYLLSTYSIEGQALGSSPSPEEMEASMERINALEAEMQATETFVFSGRLTSADEATVLTPTGTEVMVTDGPFPEAKEQIAGFYIINAEDHDTAMSWARKVTECIGHPIEARPFFDTAST